VRMMSARAVNEREQNIFKFSKIQDLQFRSEGKDLSTAC
jgi:hypothetical protein